MPQAALPRHFYASLKVSYRFGTLRSVPKIVSGKCSTTTLGVCIRERLKKIGTWPRTGAMKQKAAVEYKIPLLVLEPTVGYRSGPASAKHTHTQAACRLKNTMRSFSPKLAEHRIWRFRERFLLRKWRVINSFRGRGDELFKSAPVMIRSKKEPRRS